MAVMSSGEWCVYSGRGFYLFNIPECMNPFLRIYRCCTLNHTTEAVRFEGGFLTTKFHILRKSLFW